MELTDFVGITQDNYDALVNKVKKNSKEGVQDALKALDPATHKVVTDKASRPDKTVTVTLNDEEVTKNVPVARLPIPFQKLIVTRAAGFLCGNPIIYDHAVLDQAQAAFFTVFKKVMDDNKMDYRNIDLAYKMMSETECAEIWYSEPVADKDPDYWKGTPMEGAKFRLRVRVVSPSLGDSLYPVFDEYGDMIAFGRAYTIVSGSDKVDHFDIYTKDWIYKAKSAGSAWEMVPEKNIVGKIPVVYYSQPQPEWQDVQPLIERLEVCVSNNADTNDYFGSPIIVAHGNVQGFSSKGETGKVLEISGGSGKVEYLTWDMASEAVKLEVELLIKTIYDMTSTPNISLSEMKDIGTFSGVALKMLFLSAIMKAATKEGVFGECVQRRLNYVKAALGKIKSSIEPASKIVIKPKFKYFMPENVAEMITMLSEAVNVEPIMSQKTALTLNPLIQDPEAEYKQMEEEGKIGVGTAGVDLA